METVPHSTEDTAAVEPRDEPSVKRLGNTNEMFGKEHAEKLKRAREAKFSPDIPLSQMKLERARRMARLSIR